MNRDFIENLIKRSGQSGGGGGGGNPALRVVHSHALINLGAAPFQTDIIDVTEAGVLLSIAAIMDANQTGNPIANIEVEIDSLTQMAFPAFGGSGQSWSRTGLGAFASKGVPAGTVAGDGAVIPITARYATSCRVSFDFSTGGSGTIRIHVIRGIEQ